MGRDRKAIPSRCSTFWSGEFPAPCPGCSEGGGMPKWVRITVSDPDQFAGELEQPRLKGARNLELHFAGAAAKRADEIVRLLAGSPRTAKLEQLSLANNEVGDEG